MIWFIAGLAFAFLNAVTMLINQHYKLDGQFISGMRGVGVAALYFPAVFFVKVPDGTLFWSLIALEGFISTFFNARLYASSAIYGAGSTSRISVLSIAFGMLFWWIIDWNRFFELIENPPALTGIVFALFLTGGGFFFMLKGCMKKGELAYMMPIVVALAAMMINRKEIMSHAEFFGAAVYYCVCSILFSGLANFALYVRREGFEALKTNLSKVGNLKVGMFMAFASSATIFSGNLSALYVPNPAYISALTLTSPLWVIIINRAFGVRGKIKIFATLTMCAGLGLLLYFGDIPLHAAY